MSFDFQTETPRATHAPRQERRDQASIPSADRWDRFIPESLREDPEWHRRARLQVRFGILGAIFGGLYASFYFLIGHAIGGWIILACSLTVATVPMLLQRFRSLSFTGHLYAAVLLAGFASLSLVEGGMRGHAVAWLTCIPLCVLLLLELKSAIIWTVGVTLMTVALGLAHLSGIQSPKTYPLEWEAAIDLAGYAGLIPFMALLGIIFEVTRRRSFAQLNAALADLSEANEGLVRLNEEKNEFLNIAAHDLKNPLGVISGYAGLLQMFDDHDPESVKEQAGEILASANRMLDIIRNLLDTRATEDGGVSLKTEAVALGPVVETLLRDYHHAASVKDIEISLEGNADEFVLLADRGALHQILDNLFSNAIKYSPKGSEVRLSIAGDRLGIGQISIIDRGAGLSEEDQRKLFGKFVRLTPQPTGGESSNGLGLWIVQRMAKLMGGDVTCTSKLGEGSNFTLTLPTIARESTRKGTVALAS
jgi:signal transduction histidine kinase